jgi:hypothetical protein
MFGDMFAVIFPVMFALMFAIRTSQFLTYTIRCRPLLTSSLPFYSICEWSVVSKHWTRSSATA